MFFILMVGCLKKAKYSHCPIRKKAKGRVSAWIYISQLITTYGRCVVSCRVVLKYSQRSHPYLLGSFPQH